MYPECPLWVISGHPVTAFRMSAFGGKADVNHCVGECPLIAKSGLKTMGYPEAGQYEIAGYLAQASSPLHQLSRQREELQISPPRPDQGEA